MLNRIETLAAEGSEQFVRQRGLLDIFIIGLIKGKTGIEMGNRTYALKVSRILKCKYIFARSKSKILCVLYCSKRTHFVLFIL